MIRTPPGWGADVLTHAYQSIIATRRGPRADTPSTVNVRHIELADLRWALTRGMEDFGASRTDVIFLCVVYPLIGLSLARWRPATTATVDLPLASGFALVGPLAAVGLNEMSRRREMGEQAGWADAFAVFRSPAIGGIVLLGAILLTMFLFWLVLNVVYNLTLGPQPPASLASFVRDIFLTHAGRTMALVGVGAGFLFAVTALTISVVSFPMLLDQGVPLETAIRTSARVVARNPE